MSSENLQRETSAVSRREILIVRVLFVLFFVTLACQFVVHAKWREPYPALQMPSFGLAKSVRERGVLEGGSYDVFVVFDDCTRGVIDRNEWLSFLPDSHWNAVSQYQFAPVVPADAGNSQTMPAKQTARPLLDRVLPGRRFMRYHKDPYQAPAQLDEWVLARAEAYFPGRKASAVIFSWTQATWDIDSRNQLDARASGRRVFGDLGHCGGSL